ncbi:hypothetical protein BH10ACT7_BH10ACT7_07070 [soil metagenome]
MGQGRAAHWFGRGYLRVVETLAAQSSALPRPPDGLTVTRSAGPDPDRVLLAGGSSAVGWGALSHDLALAGAIARQASPITRRGMDVEVLAGPAVTAETVTAYLVDDLASRYDAIVLTLGTREAFEFMSVQTWRRTLTDLLDRITVFGLNSPTVVVVGAEEQSPVPMPRWFSRIIMRRAARLNAASREIVAQRDRVAYVDSAMVPTSPDANGVYDEDFAVLYPKAASAIVSVLTPLLEIGHRRDQHPVDEGTRGRALEHLRDFDGDLARINDLLRTLRDVLSVRSADLYIVDRDVVWCLATTGRAPPTQQRSGTFSTIALQHRNGIVVPDLLQDDRFRERPDVTGEPHLRFYAAHPVESREGHRVALLSIVDTEPHAFGASDLKLLRSYSINLSAVLFAGY